MRSTGANERAACVRLRSKGRSGPAIAAFEDQDEVVGGHFDDLAQPQARALCERLDVADVTHAPFGVLRSQAGVKYRVADRGVFAVALERPVEIEPAVIAQMAP